MIVDAHDLILAVIFGIGLSAKKKYPRPDFFPGYCEKNKKKYAMVNKDALKLTLNIFFFWLADERNLNILKVKYLWTNYKLILDNLIN